MNADSVVDKSVNRTWTISPCGPIEIEKGLPSEEQCPEGTQGTFLPRGPLGRIFTDRRCKKKYVGSKKYR